MELEVGMYVRRYGINKINTFIEYNKDEYKINGFYVNKNEIKKASFNIIDLIEVGDYVNGHTVIDSSEGLGILCITEDIKELNSCNIVGLLPFKFYSLKDIQIKSIVTKEQFDSMKYKIGN